MIDATKITNYNRSTYELEEFLLFCTAVAGKTAKVIEKKLEDVFHCMNTNVSYYINAGISKRQIQDNFGIVPNVLFMTPFNKIKCLVWGVADIERILRESKMGNYKKLSNLWIGLANSQIDLKTISTQELEKFKGIGPKTSRYFILHSRPNARIACLDTHILRWLKNQGYSNVPDNTPSKTNMKTYRELENIFIAEADKRKVTVAELDLKIWNESSSRSGLKLQTV